MSQVLSSTASSIHATLRQRKSELTRKKQERLQQRSGKQKKEFDMLYFLVCITEGDNCFHVKYLYRS